MQYIDKLIIYRFNSPITGMGRMKFIFMVFCLFTTMTASADSNDWRLSSEYDPFTDVVKAHSVSNHSNNGGKMFAFSCSQNLGRYGIINLPEASLKPDGTRLGTFKLRVDKNSAFSIDTTILSENEDTSGIRILFERSKNIDIWNSLIDQLTRGSSAIIGLPRSEGVEMFGLRGSMAGLTEWETRCENSGFSDGALRTNSIVRLEGTHWSRTTEVIVDSESGQRGLQLQVFPFSESANAFRKKYGRSEWNMFWTCNGVDRPFRYIQIESEALLEIQQLNSFESSPVTGGTVEFTFLNDVVIFSDVWSQNHKLFIVESINENPWRQLHDAIVSSGENFTVAYKNNNDSVFKVSVGSSKEAGEEFESHMAKCDFENM